MQYDNYRNLIEKNSLEYSRGACIPFCVREGMANYNSPKEYFSTNDREICYTKCPLECEKERFEYSLGFSNFPPKNYFQEQSKFNPGFQNKTYDELKQTVLKLSVQYRHLSTTFITQEQKTSIADLVATIGGTLGCFTGASLISLVEIIELLIQLQIAVCKSFKNQIRQSTQNIWEHFFYL